MKMKKLILTNLPYVLFVYPFGKLAEAFRLAPGTGLSEKILSIGDGFRQAFASVLPAFHPMDILVGIAGAVVIRLAVYFKGKNAKKFRHGIRLCTMECIILSVNDTTWTHRRLCK